MNRHTSGGHDPSRIDDIPTQWSLLRRAHDDAVSQAGPARQALVVRYAHAVRGYIGAMVTNQADADELSQEVMIKLMRGDFGRADPTRGRFRDLLKAAVRNLVKSHLGKRQRRATADYDVEEAAGPNHDDADPAWDQNWQAAVMDNTWAALLEYEKSVPGSVAYVVLKLRADNPDEDSAKLAARLSEATSRTFSAATARQQLHRARLRFAQLLLEEVSRGLADPSPDRVAQELADLGLLVYVREFLPEDWATTGQLRGG
jgi:RNA polymerase sigma factor (sigma-70 family)